MEWFLEWFWFLSCVCYSNLGFLRGKLRLTRRLRRFLSLFCPTPVIVSPSVSLGPRDSVEL